MNLNIIYVWVLLMCLVSLGCADTIQVNGISALNSSRHDIGWFTSGNLSEIEFMFLNFTINASSDRVITNVSLNFTAGGSNACALGNLQDDYCFNYYNTTSYKWVEFVYNTTTQFFKDEGHLGDFIYENRSSDGQNMTVTYLIDEHYNPNVLKHYGSLYNFSDVKYQSGSNIRLTKNNYIRMLSKNFLVPGDADYYKLDTRFNTSTTLDTDSIFAYICNSSYNETYGDVVYSDNCKLVCSASASEIVNTKFRCLFTSDLLGGLGDGRNVSIVYISDIVNQNRYFALKTFYSKNVSRDVSWVYSNDKGSTWNLPIDGYETETNINYFYADSNITTFYYQVIATNNNSEKTVLEGNVTWDLTAIINYKPRALLIVPQNNDTLFMPINITFDVNDGSNDPLNISLFLYNINGTGVPFLNTTIRQNMNKSNISYLWNESIDYDSYYMLLEACETNTSDLFCGYSMHVFDLEANPPIVVSSSSNASSVYHGGVVLFTINVTEVDESIDDVWITIMGNIVNKTNAVVGLNYLSYTADDFYGNYSVGIYVNDTYGFYNYTTDLYLNVMSFKGVVPYGSGVPFYTSTANPYECGQMWEGQSCVVAYVVNSTGSRGLDYEFFAWANGSDGVSVISNSLYVSTISAIPNATGYMNSNDTLYCNITFGDPDGDGVSFVNSTIGWYQNDSIMKNGSLWLDCLDNSSWCQRGMNVFCFACVEDEHGFVGECGQSYSLSVINEPPTLSPYITPAVPDVGNNLVCNENATDPEGEVLYYSYRWYINDTLSDITSRTVGNLATTSGESWICSVNVSDGYNLVVANSSAVVIGGACPSVPVLLFPPNWSQVSGIPVEFDWSDSTVAIGSATYHLQVSSSPVFSTTYTDISVIPSEYSSNDSFVEEQYYWRVRAYANGCYSNWTRAWVFSFVDGTCNDGIKNFHNGEQEVGVDCGGPCDPCVCASDYLSSVSGYFIQNGTSSAVYGGNNITTLEALEMHCRDGCFGPEFGESDTDCGGFGAWACPDCGLGQNCTSDYECAEGLYCNFDLGVGDYGQCADNVALVFCSNGIYNPTLNESDIDCGGPCDGCDVGDRCVTTLDCKNDLVCNQYDICQEPTDDIKRKRGRQLGGIATQGLSMNQAFCSGINDRYYEVSSSEMLDWGCGWDEEADTNIGERYTYVIDTTGLTAVWDSVKEMVGSGKQPVLVYHLEEMYIVDGKTVWAPLWIGSDGHEYKCEGETDDGDMSCANRYIYVANDFEGYDDDYTGGGGGAGSLVGDCRPASYNGYLCNYYGDSCDYHCDTMGDSDVFRWGNNDYDSAIISGLDKKNIFNTGCMFINLCKNTKYRLSVRVLHDVGYSEFLPYKIGLDTSVIEFTTTDNDGGVLKPKLSLHNNKGFKDDPIISEDVCEMPAMWDVTRCDGEGVSFGILESLTRDEDYFFTSTGCSYWDTAYNRWAAVTLCGMPATSFYGTDDDRLKSYPLSDFGCDGNSEDIRIALLDMTSLYETHFKQGLDSKYAYDPLKPRKAIHMLITRNTVDKQECLVYDNLLSNAYKYQPNLIGEYYNLYKGGMFIDIDDPKNSRYGPRLRLPVCEGCEYNVLFFYIPDVSTNIRPPGGYSSVSDYALTQIWLRVVQSGAIVIDANRYFGFIETFIRDLLTSWEPDCRKPDTSVCLEQGTILNMMGDNKGVEFIHSTKFKVSRDSKMVGQNAVVVSSYDNSRICYADYLVNFDSVLNSGLGYKHNVNIDEKSYLGVDEWLFSGVTNSGEASTTVSITDPDAWIDNFFAIFDPFDIRPPIGLELDEDGNVIFSFEKFIKSLLYLLFTDPWQFIILIFKLVLFYVAKYMFWILLYALLSYLWTRAAPNVSIYWFIIIFLFIAIVILGWWSSYSEFVDMFKKL